MKRYEKRFRIAGPPKTLSVETVLTIHERLVFEFTTASDPISPAGVRDIGLLESAVSRQHTGSQGHLKYPTPESNAAALLYGVCNNHAFHNGNKRTALVAGIMHLDANNLVLDNVSKDDLFRFMLRVASHTILGEAKSNNRPHSDEEVQAISAWLADRSRKIKRGERSIPYSELYDIVQRFGYEIGSKNHNKVEILKRMQTGIFFKKEKLVCVFKVGCLGDSRIVPLDELKDLRSTLKLTENDGVDSESFYDTGVVVDTFITQHRTVLRRLARV